MGGQFGPAIEWRPDLSIVKRPPSATRVNLSYNLEEIAATRCGSRTFSQKTGEASVSAFGPKRTFHYVALISLWGVKRTCRFALHMSAFDPKRTSGVGAKGTLLLYAAMATTF